MLDTITNYIEMHKLLPAQGRLVVAVSGGADSLCLLHLLHQLCGPGKCYPRVTLHAAHLDHQLRGEVSAQQAHTLTEWVKSWGIPITTESRDVYALAKREQRSLEEAARTARYRFLREMAQGDPIAVAHHQDDHVETLVLHWLRGGGMASMLGLQPRQLDIIRPLLCVRREDTQAYCAQHQLVPLEDESNSDVRFVRNRIRHEVLPLLAQINPGIHETLTRTATVMQTDFAWIETQVQQCWQEVVEQEQDDCVTLKISALHRMSLSIQRHLLRRASAQLCGGQSPLELRHFGLIEELLQRPATQETISLHLPQQLQAIRISDILLIKRVLRSNVSEALVQAPEVTLTIPGEIAVPHTSWLASAEIVEDRILQQVLPALRQQDWPTVWGYLPSTPEIVYADRDALKSVTSEPSELRLRVRTRRDGDRMQPLGMTQEKKVQDILVNKRVPRAERAHIPLFFSATHCVWLAGVQLDHRVRLTAQTQRIVRLSITRIENEQRGIHAPGY